MRTEIKKLRSALALGDAERAAQQLPAVLSIIDRSIQKGVVHRNTAARYKSRLTMHVAEAAAASSSVSPATNRRVILLNAPTFVSSFFGASRSERYSRADFIIDAPFSTVWRADAIARFASILVVRDT